MREWENASWAAGRNEAAVIGRVGELVARRALGFVRSGDHILLLAGKGHNGDDARAALPGLSRHQYRLINITDPAKDRDDLIQALSDRPAWVIDGLFGIGLNRPLSPEWQALINAVNEAALSVLAIDTPSGLDAETGIVQGAAIRATVTLTVGAPKQGLLAATAIEYVGRLEVAPEIGLIACPLTGELNWILPGDFAAFPPARQPQSHKGTYGHAVILAGSLGYHGAAVLAARGATRARPGLVTVVTEPRVYGPVAGQLQAAMVHPWEDGFAIPDNTSAILIGPGLAAKDLPDGLKRAARELWVESALPIIADAGALDLIAEDKPTTDALRIITPHPGEAARLLRITTAEVQANRVSVLRELSRRLGDCHVVLKGHQTLIGHSTGQIIINGSGNPGLGQGGSGDLLAGFLAGLLAQPVLRGDMNKLLAYAVWQHGASADQLERDRPNWTVEDLADALGSARASNA
jgi:NAD(P)H-hydrate epimerase